MVINHVSKCWDDPPSTRAWIIPTNKTPGGFSFESPQAQPDTTQDAQDHTEDGGENLAANECHGHVAPLG